MIFDYPFVTESITLVVGMLVGWLPNRRKTIADTRMVEVDVLKRSLQALSDDVIDPLRNDLNTLREDYEDINKKLKKLQYAINKMYDCPTLATCPISSELQKQEGTAAGRTKRVVGKGQRQPSDQGDLGAANRAVGDGDAKLI